MTVDADGKDESDIEVRNDDEGMKVDVIKGIEGAMVVELGGR